MLTKTHEKYILYSKFTNIVKCSSVCTLYCQPDTGIRSLSVRDVSVGTLDTVLGDGSVGVEILGTVLTS